MTQTLSNLCNASKNEVKLTRRIDFALSSRYRSEFSLPKIILSTCQTTGSKTATVKNFLQESTAVSYAKKTIRNS